MSKKNDERIKAQLAKVELLKKEVATKPRQVLETNGVIYGADGHMVNLHTVQDVDILVDTLATLRAAKTAQEEAAGILEVENYEFKWGGYAYKQWEADFKMRVAEINRGAKKKQLATIEGKLKNLVSEEEKTAMELDDIEALLG